MHALGKQSLNSLAAQLADSAVAALIAEAQLSPKPALVDLRGSGAHHDLDLSLMQASALALWPAFHDMAEAALQHGRCSLELREALGRIGREGEAAMLAATRGVNTHRGAIWVLGLLVAAAALEPENATSEALSQRVSALALLEDRFAAAHRRASHGQQVEQRYGARGAREEAQLGLPGVVLHGLPQLLRSRANGADENTARLDALLAIMATLADTCVLYRAGPEGLAAMHAGAAAVLAAGGCSTLAGRRCLRTLENDLLRLNASPGGAADLLAACLFMDQLGQPGGSL